MKKEIFALSILISVLLVFGCTSEVKSNVAPIDGTSLLACNLTTIAGFDYSFKSQDQNNLTVLHYSQPGEKTGNAFYFGYVTLETPQAAQKFYEEVTTGLREFSAKYPDNSQTLECSVSGINGICGVYNGKLETFVWVDNSTYKILNNFHFVPTDQPNQKLGEVVTALSSCTP
jgi:hypothetical protein